MKPQLEKEIVFVFGCWAESENGVINIVTHYPQKYKYGHWLDIKFDDLSNDGFHCVQPTGRYKLLTDENGKDHIKIESHVTIMVKATTKVTVVNQFKWYKFWLWFPKGEEITTWTRNLVKEHHIVWVPDSHIVCLERYKPTEEIFECGPNGSIS